MLQKINGGCLTPQRSFWANCRPALTLFRQRQPTKSAERCRFKELIFRLSNGEVRRLRKNRNFSVYSVMSVFQLEKMHHGGTESTESTELFSDRLPAQRFRHAEGRGKGLTRSSFIRDTIT